MTGGSNSSSIDFPGRNGHNNSISGGERASLQKGVEIEEYNTRALGKVNSKRKNADNSAVNSTSLTWAAHDSPKQLVEADEPGPVYTKRWWKFKTRGFDDDSDTDWWFASTAVPLLAATIGPLANVLSLAALVTYWRMSLDGGDGTVLPELAGIPFRDPRWCYWLNVVSLICGFVGNLFLLFNFTNYVRYIIALPVSIFLWFLATAILVGITVGMHVYTPPVGALETYTQGYWDAVIAAILYFVCSSLLMVNMLGYFLGHYPQRFELSDHQRTLILQTMLFFIWLAGGAAVFSRIEQHANPSAPQTWEFVDALYFCDVTILTVGFGDLYPVDNLGRGLVFPFSVGGIIMLGLVISSLHNFAAELGQDNIVKKHIQKERSRTYDRTVTESSELTRELAIMPRHLRRDLKKLKISAPLDVHRGNRKPSIYAPATVRKSSSSDRRSGVMLPIVHRRTNLHELMSRRKPKLILLKEERDRFNAMRDIQKATQRFKRWWALTMSITAFTILWLVGAVVFWRVEQSQQGMTYFQALYFCYVSLLTIGYGDLAPKSNAGRAFFVVWSLVAVPTMTILISDMGNTVIDGFREGTFHLADFTVLPQKGVWKEFMDRHPKIMKWIEEQRENRRRKKRLKKGMQFGSVADADRVGITGEVLEPGNGGNAPTLETLADQAEKDEEQGDNMDEGRLARRLASAIRNVAADLRAEHERKYSYEEWVELTRLIRFTSNNPSKARHREETEGMVEWDWIGEDSPMMSGHSEPEFVLQRLCESLTRYVRRAEKRRKQSAAARNGQAGSNDTSEEEEEEQFGPLRRNPTWDELEGNQKQGVSKVELFDDKKHSSGPSNEVGPLQRANTHHADDFDNDAGILARHDCEQEGPMGERQLQCVNVYTTDNA